MNRLIFSRLHGIGPDFGLFHPGGRDKLCPPHSALSLPPDFQTFRSIDTYVKQGCCKVQKSWGARSKGGVKIPPCFPVSDIPVKKTNTTNEEHTNSFTDKFSREDFCTWECRKIFFVGGKSTTLFRIKTQKGKRPF